MFMMILFGDIHVLTSQVKCVSIVCVKKRLMKPVFGVERTRYGKNKNKEKLFKYLLFSKILSHGQLGRFRHLAAAL